MIGERPGAHTRLVVFQCADDRIVCEIETPTPNIQLEAVLLKGGKPGPDTAAWS